MYLVEIFLPLFDNSGQAFQAAVYQVEKQRLTEHFGGLTAFTRAPAEGTWENSRTHAKMQDQIVIFEIMSPSLDRSWWRLYREHLEKTFRQDRIVVRATRTELI